MKNNAVSAGGQRSATCPSSCGKIQSNGNATSRRWLIDDDLTAEYEQLA
jgi:hypothetical protein